jgi:hypothetical protein
MIRKHWKWLIGLVLVLTVVCAAVYAGMLQGKEMGSWKKIPKAPIVEARGTICSALVGNKLVVWGGTLNDKPLSDGAVYDIDKGAWKKMPLAPIEGTEHFAMLPYGEKNVLIWGGEDYPYGAIYDTNKDEWKKMAVAPISLGMEPFTSAILGNKLLVWGIGVTRLENPVGALYDIDKDTWTKMPEAPMLAIDDWPAFIYKNKFVVWGGRSPEKSDCHGAVYDIDSNTWKKMAPAPLEIGITKEPGDLKQGIKAGRNWGASILVGNKLLIWSGCPGPLVAQPTLTFSDGAVYDIDNDTWKKMAPAPIEPREFANNKLWRGASSWGNKVVIWGGMKDKFYNDGAIYDIEKDSWEKIPEAPVKSKQEIYGYGLFGYIRTAPGLLGNKLVVWGGQEQIVWGGKDPTVGAIYDLEKKKWELMEKCPIVGRDYHHPYFYENKLIIWGGRDATTRYTDGAIYDFGK